MFAGAATVSSRMYAHGRPPGALTRDVPVALTKPSLLTRKVTDDANVPEYVN